MKKAGPFIRSRLFCYLYDRDQNYLRNNNCLIMVEKRIKLCWLSPTDKQDLNLPQYETVRAAGMDVEAAVQMTLSIDPGEIVLLPTGFAVALPEGYELQVRPRSGLAVKHGVTIVNSPGTIDEDYRGEVKIALIGVIALLS